MTISPIPLYQLMSPSILWSSAASAIHLTFDDGPHPVATPLVLDLLKERGMRATFFLVGQHAQRYPAIVRRIIKEGHAIGNHTYRHTVLAFRSLRHIEEEVNKAEEALTDAAGTRPRFFRPPYGLFDPRTVRYVRSRGYQFVMWTVDSKDYTYRSGKTIARNMGRKLSPGAILLFHDNGATQSKISRVVPPILDQIQTLGLPTASLP